MKCSLGISNFLEEISSVSHSIIFLCSLHWSVRKAFLSLLAILWNSAFRWLYHSFSPLPFSSLFSVICKASSDSRLPCWISSSQEWFWSLPPVQCYRPPSIVLQAITLSDLISWIYLSLPLCNHKWLDLGHTRYITVVDFWWNSVEVKEHTLYDINLWKVIETFLWPSI